MVFRREHWDCNESECKQLTASVRIDGKWTRIGFYGSECHEFEPLDLEKEEKERQEKQRLDRLKSEIRQTKQESRDRRKIIENEFNIAKTFLEQN